MKLHYATLSFGIHKELVGHFEKYTYTYSRTGHFQNLPRSLMHQM